MLVRSLLIATVALTTPTLAAERGQRCPEVLACPTILDLSRNKGSHKNINASCARCGHVANVAIRSVNWARMSSAPTT